MKETAVLLILISLLELGACARCYEDSNCALGPCYTSTWCNKTLEQCEVTWKECPPAINECYDAGCYVNDGTCVMRKVCADPAPNTCQKLVCSTDYLNKPRCSYPSFCDDGDECAISYCNATTNECYLLVDKTRPDCVAEPTDEFCNFYSNLDWVSLSYRWNAYRACRDTGNDPKMNCVRSFLKRALNSPKRYPEEKKQAFRDILAEDITPIRFASEFYQPIYQDHADAYKACGCSGTPAARPLWAPTSVVPLGPLTAPAITAAWGRCEPLFGKRSTEESVMSVPLSFPSNLDFRGALSTWLQMREVVFGNETFMGLMLADYDPETGNATVIVLPWEGIYFSIPDKMNVASSAGKLASLGITIQPSFVFPPMSPIAESAEPRSDEPSQSTSPTVGATSDASNGHFINVVVYLVTCFIFF